MQSFRTTLSVLNPRENQIGFLDPDHIDIVETNELYKLKTLEITHPLNQKYDSILIPGNKIWQQNTTDNNSCLYIIRGPKTYNYNENTINIQAIEAAAELGQYKTLRDSNFQWQINPELIQKYLGELFNPGNITPTTTTTEYNGALTPLAILQEIQTRTNGEFQYRYQYHPTSEKIKRYIDYQKQIGKTHPQIIELGYNTTQIELEIDENNVAIAASPIGQPSTKDTFHEDRQQFENLQINKGQEIPQYYTKQDKEYTPGPLVKAPYSKQPHTNYVLCDDPTQAHYTHIQGKEGSHLTYPRLITFNSTESHPINMYWECVKTLKQHLQPEIEIKCTPTSLNRLTQKETTYNVGDTIYIQLPGRPITIQCRITKTIKNPKTPETTQITIKTYHNNFINDLYNKYYKNNPQIYKITQKLQREKL
jgi:hypothetical protein